jgi:hypothetical protein
MDRLRHRPDHFMYRGNMFFYHRLADGPTLARLDPYSDGEQTWPLNSGRVISVTAAEIRDITLQVHGIELPEVNPDLKFISDPTLEPRLAALERLVAELAARIAEPVMAAAPEPLVIEEAPEPVEPQEPQPDPRDDALAAAEAELAALRARVAELEAADISVFAEAPLLPAPDALMSDWGEVGAYPGVPDDFVQLMTGDETLEQAVERMTLGVDELLDMATVLSDPSLELALCTVPPERVNEWTEKLITEKARLRRLRGTVDENFGRENLVSRVQGMFAQVGAKR